MSQAEESPLARLKALLQPEAYKNDGQRVPISQQYGGCVALYAPDDLDQASLAYAEQLVKASPNTNIYAADIGSSPYCPQSIRLAQSGLHVDAFDLEPPFAELSALSQHLSGRLTYQQINLHDLTNNHLSESYSIVYSNRCLFFLTARECQRVIHLFFKHSIVGARFYLSFASLNSQVAENYPDRDKPLFERYAKVDNALANKLGINVPVCFYYLDEVEQYILPQTDVKILAKGTSSTGTIRFIFEKC